MNRRFGYGYCKKLRSAVLVLVNTVRFCVSSCVPIKYTCCEKPRSAVLVLVNAIKFFAPVSRSALCWDSQYNLQSFIAGDEFKQERFIRYYASKDPPFVPSFRFRVRSKGRQALRIDLTLAALLEVWAIFILIVAIGTNGVMAVSF